MFFDQLVKYIPLHQDSQLQQAFELIDKTSTKCNIKKMDGYELTFSLGSEDRFIILFSDDQEFKIAAANCSDVALSHPFKFVRSFEEMLKIINCYIFDDDDGTASFELN